VADVLAAEPVVVAEPVVLADEPILIPVEDEDEEEPVVFVVEAPVAFLEEPVLEEPVVIVEETVVVEEPIVIVELVEPARRAARKQRAANPRPVGKTQRFAVEYRLERVLRATDIRDAMRRATALGASEILTIERLSD
jgi:hypothetical protein